MFSNTFFNEKVWILPKISPKCVPKDQNNNIPALVKIMACHRLGDKPLYEPMMVKLPTHICDIQPQSLKAIARWQGLRVFTFTFGILFGLVFQMSMFQFISLCFNQLPIQPKNTHYCRFPCDWQCGDLLATPQRVSHAHDMPNHSD